MKDVEEWLKGRPDSIRRIVAAIPPNALYRIKETGQIGYPIAYSEDETVKLSLRREHNPNIWFERDVFGLGVEHLESYEPPH